MMKSWADAVSAELNLPADVNVEVILDVARVAAHSVERPAAPVTTSLLGVAVAGRDECRPGCRQDPGPRGDVAAVGRVDGRALKLQSHHLDPSAVDERLDLPTIS